MTAKRKAISPKVRFEVFKRDSFTCQYCGNKAPESVLEIDHISPVSKGGKSDILNLITACWDCNSGKGARELSDNSSIEKQRAQLETLNQRREQLQMMLKWRDGLASIKEDTFLAAEKAVNGHIPGLELNEAGVRELKALVRKFGLSTVLDAVEVSAEKYLEFDGSGFLLDDSAAVFIKKIGGVAFSSTLPPHEKVLRYIRGILRNRFSYTNESRAIELLREAHAAGASLEDLRSIALSQKNWTPWAAEMEGIICG